ncbi:MAG: lactoylglutathione lyase [Firmicutes bacterium]|nr:lactoylglutathione lyase [Bacillota bacterium]
MDYKFVHSCIRVMDLEASIEFYQNAFGLKESRRKEFSDFTLVYLKADEGDFELELTYNHDQEESYIIGNGYSHIALTVDDLQKSYKKHQDMGYKVGEITSLSEGSNAYYFISDPDGYDIEIIQG